MGCGNLLSGLNSNDRLETTENKPLDYKTSTCAAYASYDKN